MTTRRGDEQPIDRSALRQQTFEMAPGLVQGLLEDTSATGEPSWRPMLSVLMAECRRVVRPGDTTPAAQEARTVRAIKVLDESIRLHLKRGPVHMAAAAFAAVVEFCAKENRSGPVALELTFLMVVVRDGAERPDFLLALERERPDAMQRYLKHMLLTRELQGNARDFKKDLLKHLLPALVYVLRRAKEAAPDPLTTKRCTAAVQIMKLACGLPGFGDRLLSVTVLEAVLNLGWRISNDMGAALGEPSNGHRAPAGVRPSAAASAAAAALAQAFVGCLACGQQVARQRRAAGEPPCSEDAAVCAWCFGHIALLRLQHADPRIAIPAVEALVHGAGLLALAAPVVAALPQGRTLFGPACSAILEVLPAVVQRQADDAPASAMDAAWLVAVSRIAEAGLDAVHTEASMRGVLHMVLNVANKWAAEAARTAGRPGGGCALDAPAAVDLSEGAAFARRQASSQPGTVGDHVGMLTSTAVRGLARAIQSGMDREDGAAARLRFLQENKVNCLEILARYIETVDDFLRWRAPEVRRIAGKAWDSGCHAAAAQLVQQVAQTAGAPGADPSQRLVHELVKASCRLITFTYCWETAAAPLRPPPEGAPAAACFDAGVAALLPLRPRMSQLTTTQSLTMLRSLAGSMRLLVSPERRAQAPSAVKQVVPEIEALAGLLAALLRAHAPLRPLLTEPAPHMDWPGWAAGRSALVAAMPLRARQLEASLQPVDDAIAGRPAAAAAPAKGSAAKAAPAAPASTAATAAVRVRTEEQAAAAAAALLEEEAAEAAAKQRADSKAARKRAKRKAAKASAAAGTAPGADAAAAPAADVDAARAAPSAQPVEDRAPDAAAAESPAAAAAAELASMTLAESSAGSGAAAAWTAGDYSDTVPAARLEDEDDWRLCPLTREVLRDPVLCADGHTYEREAILAWFVAGHDTSPVTSEPLGSRDLTPNFTLKSLINAEQRAAT